MSDHLRRGWCPGALRPMMARDGLLVRVRITGGILPAGSAMALADLAMRHGNGLFDLSARGNLQMRGVTEGGLERLQNGLRSLGLIDRDAEGEAVRNVMASPLAGLASWLDIRSMVADLEKAVVTDEICRTLPGKFAILVDDGSQPSLADTDADLRFDWQQDTALFSVGLAGTATDAIRIDCCRAEDLVARAIDLLRVAAQLLLQNGASRLRYLIPLLGRSATVRAFQGDDRIFTPGRRPTTPRSWVGWHQTDRNLGLLGLAVAFGRLDASMLRSAAINAAKTSQGEIRLTPWRMLLIPDAHALDAIPGFIVDADDPRLGVAACVGEDGCSRGTTPTHAHASSLAALLAGAAPGVALHVSGCAKGCAKPSATKLTIVAKDGRYGLVRDGRASDPPTQDDLTLAEVAALLRACA